MYGNVRPEIVTMFETFWDASTEIDEADLDSAAAAWKRRQYGNAVVAASRGGRSLVDVLRTAPTELDALNVRMVVHDTVTDADELAVLDNADKNARDLYGQAFAVYWDWDSMRTDASPAYLVNYEWPARREIDNGALYWRNASLFPDFEQDGETFHVAYEIDSIERITFGAADEEAIRRAFHAYVRNGATGEEGSRRSYNFPISQLAPYIAAVA